jgi:hypothetical protein
VYDKSNTTTRSASTAPHRQQHQRHRQRREQKYLHARALLKEAEDAADAAVFLAQTLGLRAKHLPSARHAKLAVDGLKLAIAAHTLAADLFAEMESEEAA